MKSIIDVFWSFRSPYSYLVTPDLLKLRQDYDVELRFRPVLPIALRDSTILFDKGGQQKVHYIILDVFRRAEYLGMSIQLPSPDPIVQDLTTLAVAKEQPYIYRLTALGIEAQRRGKGIELAYAISHLIWAGTQNWHEGDALNEAIASAGLDLADMETAIAQYDFMSEIALNQKALDAAGHWGVPTMVFNGEPFFGQDRIDTLRWRLDQAGV